MSGQTSSVQRHKEGYEKFVPVSAIGQLAVVDNRVSLRAGKGQDGALMKSAAIKRSIKLDGHKTSVSLEEAFWTEFKKIAHFRGMTVSQMVGAIHAKRKQSNLSSAIRVFVLEHLQNKDKSASSPHSGGTSQQ